MTDAGRAARSGPGPAGEADARGEVTAERRQRAQRRDDAALAAAVLAVDPAGLGGVVLQGPADARRDGWLAALRTLLPADAPWRRVPVSVDESRLLGGWDLTATLQQGRACWQRGLLAEADGGLVVVPGAERLPVGTAARIARALEPGQIDGPDGRPQATRLACIALDEAATPADGEPADDAVPEALAERLAFRLDLRALGRDGPRPDFDAPWPWSLPATAEDIAAARRHWPRVTVDPAIVESLCAAASALGLDSLRLPWFALHAARIAAALAGRVEVDADSVRWAARVVLAPRARQLPAANEAPSSEPADEPRDAPAPAEASAAAPAPPAPREPSSTDAPETAPNEPPPEAESLLDAVRAALPAGLLDRLVAASGAAGAARRPASAGGAVNAPRGSGAGRGRLGSPRAGLPRQGARLDLVETLRTAAPWQPLRRREAAAHAALPSDTARVQVRAEDLRVRRRLPRRIATTIFLVDASGSAALHRLAEAKGAVEQLLADCYVRRDQVAVLAFRGNGAELLLPPTRSLARARRGLAGLPGGGGTPLASGLDAARDLAERLQRRGGLPLLVLLTDGRANLARDGTPGRAAAFDDALLVARAWRRLQLPALVVDTSPLGPPLGTALPPAARLAEAMGARCLVLPPSSAAALSRSVQATAAAAAGRA